MIYSLVFVAVALGPGIGASPLMATPPMMARDLSFGTCTNPCVSFSSGAFVPENLGDFPHKSVGDPGVIFPFICSQLVNKCGLHKTDPAVLACLKVAPRAEALGAKGIAADTFNAALGFTTHFATVDKSGRNTRSLAGSARDEPAHAPQDGVKGAAPPPKDHDGRPPPSPSSSLPPPPPAHKPSPAPAPGLLLRDAGVGTNPDKHEGPKGQDGGKGGAPPAKGRPPPPPSSSLPPPQSPPPAHKPSPAPAPGLLFRDVDVGEKGPAPDKHEGPKGQDGGKGGAPPAKGGPPPPPSSSLPPPQSPPPAHKPSPAPAPGLLFRDVDVGAKGPAPDKHEGPKGQDGGKGGAPPAKGGPPPPPSSSLPPPQSPPPAHRPSPVPAPGLL